MVIKFNSMSLIIHISKIPPELQQSIRDLAMRNYPEEKEKPATSADQKTISAGSSEDLKI